MKEFDEMNGGAPADEYLSLDEKTSKSLMWAVLSLVVSLASVVLFFVPWLNVILGIVGVGLSVVSRLRMGYFHGLSVAGLIIGIIGIVFSAFYIFALSELFSTLLKAISGR